ncbi:unnamed protein product [Darwinula stevensoni]|uniref:C-type lectin domain-containing protein n=1 Tax=Darwinula stevensoni TaxID=69355 RepID=A0A7R8XEY3_9CRUS|nr:unnamed protein product [Darwinula stevensoni]CAG0894444.1 unnamed protein product [Darwinula stevensoni]
MRLFRAWVIGVLLPAVEMGSGGGNNNNSGSGCSDGWIPNGDFCFSFSKSTATWAEAKAQCEADGASLAKPADDDENRFFGNNVNFLWTWIAAVRNGNSFVNRDSVRASSYDNDDGNVTQGYFYPSFMYSRQWRNVDCNNQYGLICELSHTNSCIDIVAIGSKCYMPIQTLMLSWDVANFHCTRAGGILAKMDSAAKTAAFAVFRDTGRFSGIDPSKEPPIPLNLWIGAKRDSPGSPFKWTDGSELAFADWFPGYPDSSSGDCVAAFPSTWSTVGSLAENNVTRRFGFVCRRAKSRSALADFIAYLYQTVIGFFL